MNRIPRKNALALAVVVLTLGVLVGDGPTPTNSAPPKSEKGKKPRAKSHNFPDTASEYAKMVEPELGVPPKIDLGRSVEIPLYVKGVRKYGNLGRSCDNPTLLGKATISGSVLQRHPGRSADGKPLPDVVWVSFGRNSSDRPGKAFGSVQMIGYNKRTGATAFFESSDRISPWVTQDEKTLRMRGELPGIDDPREFDRAFVPPGAVQCVQCHQSDPFITDSFINAAKMPGTDENVVPILGRDSPYYVIGGENWDMRTIHIKGNACFRCHRVGMGTLTLFTNNGWDPNGHMPPHDPGSLKGDLRELLDAWEEGPDKVEGAAWVIPPARGKGRRLVGKDYPYKAWFNEHRRGKFGAKRVEKGEADYPKTDRDKEYDELLKKRPDIRRKVESGGATKEDVLARMKNGGDEQQRNKK